MKWALAVLGVILVVVVWMNPGTESTSHQAGGPSTGNEVPDDGQSGLVVLDDAPFAMKFGRAQLTDDEELELIQLAFQDYLSFVKVGQRGPIGDNRDFVKALTGGNVYKIAPIPPGHARINEKGELTDRFGIPFAIHPLSESSLEVRAAGPDQILWTADDRVNLTVSGRAIKEELLGD